MIDEINFTSVKKVNDPKTGKLDNYRVVIDGITSNVPISEGNAHYVEIKRQVDAGELTIEDAD
tara:strand:- start:346 stop:534 length:189 start_codon:yes stop_codon:yes gene_type:complete